MVKKEKIYASIKAPAIAAAVDGLYSFVSETDAVNLLNLFQENFIVSKNHQTETDKNEKIFWIRGFALSEKKTEDGFKGNFGHFKIKKVSKKKFTIEVKKLEIELKFHPEKVHQKHRHPNWGHPILRSVKKKKIYETMEAAHKELILLQEQYPLVTIPAQEKLYAMIFEKNNNKKSTVKKYILIIEKNSGGGYYINCEENKSSKNAFEAITKPKQEVGLFTSKVLLRRAQRKVRSRQSIKSLAKTKDTKLTDEM